MDRSFFLSSLFLFYYKILLTETLISKTVSTCIYISEHRRNDMALDIPYLEIAESSFLAVWEDE